MPIPIENVRLVTPYETTQIRRVVDEETGVEEERAVKVFQDVIVDKVRMERHTTGVDPFTGIDYGSKKFPEAHQFDPKTGVPVFNRYIAGTHHRIEWPWEKEESVAEEAHTPEIEDAPRLRDKIIHPIAALKGELNKKPEEAPEPESDVVEEYTEAVKQVYQKKGTEVPTSKDGFNPREQFDGIDTGRNPIEQAIIEQQSPLGLPPFPDAVSRELGLSRDLELHIRDKRKKAMRTQFVAPPKTPMQLRWEADQKKKAEMMKEPLVKEEDLFEALGKHIQAQRGAGKGSGKAEKLEDVD